MFVAHVGASAPHYLVLIACPVRLSAELAVCWWKAVVHAMLHRLQGSQVREHGFQIVIVKMTEFPEGHDRIKLSCLHIAGAHHLDKQRLIVITDSGCIG